MSGHSRSQTLPHTRLLTSGHLLSILQYIFILNLSRRDERGQVELAFG